METLRLTGRRSSLSLLQIERVRQAIHGAFPGIQTVVLPVDTRGDQLQDIPLQTVEGTDFFTAEVKRMLETQEADIAVHSLKDLSAAHFFGPHHFAVTERDDVRDIALFHPGIEQKLARGETIVMGTCSPRREDMAMEFLSKALPASGHRVSITVKPIRGNVEARLRKLASGQYDGTILATAGLNRLLQHPGSADEVRGLLAGKRRMFLPLVECVPAPCQGAIVAEAIPGNARAREIIAAINEPDLYRQCIAEKSLAMRFGTGCDQRFGVTHIAAGAERYLFASGTDGRGRSLQYWQNLPRHSVPADAIFSSTDRMGDFFRYSFPDAVDRPQTPAVFVSSHTHLRHPDLVLSLKEHRVWAAGTRTWLALAAKGIWVEGSADALGLESLPSVWSMPLIQLNPAAVTVITHRDAARAWTAKGWKTLSTCTLHPQFDPGIAASVAGARFLFWTSVGQFTQYAQAAAADAIHACPYGETAELLTAKGLHPLIFPTIKSFQAWRQSITR